MAAKKKTGTGHRLSSEQKSAIADASADVTNVELAEKFDTTPQTIANYRSGGARRGGRRPAVAAAATLRKTGKNGVSVQLDGDYLVIRVPRSKALVKDLVTQLLG